MSFPSWSEIECAAVTGGLAPTALRRMRDFYRRVAECPELRMLLSAMKERLAEPKPCDGAEAAKVFPRVEERDAFHLLVLLGGFTAASAGWRQRGFPAELFTAAWRDAGIWTAHHEENLHSTGISLRILNWMKLHCESRIARPGRLEFEFDLDFNFKLRIIRNRDGRPEAVPESADLPDVDTLLAPGDPVAAIHIPADGPLLPGECLNSLRRFRSFAARHLTGRPPRALVCESWLLDPQLRRLLPPDSNIVQFQQIAGTLFPLAQPADTVWRVFGDAGLRDGIFNRRNCNSLQRRIVDFVRDGGEFHMGFLYIPIEELDALL